MLVGVGSVWVGCVCVWGVWGWDVYVCGECGGGVMLNVVRM